MATRNLTSDYDKARAKYKAEHAEESRINIDQPGSDPSIPPSPSHISSKTDPDTDPTSSTSTTNTKPEWVQLHEQASEDIAKIKEAS